MASGILLQFRRAPLHVLGNLLYSAFFVAWLVYRVLLGFSFVFLRGFFSKSGFRSHRVGVCCCSFIARLALLIRAQ